MLSKVKPAFTIVELLIVIIVIGVLAAIVMVSYRGITDQSKNSAAQGGAKQARDKILTYAVQNNDLYPADLDSAGISSSDGTTYSYSVSNSSDPKTFCLTSTVSGVSYYVSNVISTPTSGSCPVVIGDGSFIQTINSDNCPTTRIRAVDARDSHTYWVQKLDDGKCWMLTNLAYAGGGTNTYGDVKTLSNGTGTPKAYNGSFYYVTPYTTNYTTEPNNPSTSTDGGATNSQYGYLYNWCGAMGGQLGTDACYKSPHVASPDSNVSACPAGWRLPIGNGGEFAALNTAVNGGSTSSDAGIRAVWLAQRSGAWANANSFSSQGTYGVYWSSTQASYVNAYAIIIQPSSIGYLNSYSKDIGYAVRCISV